MTATARIPDGNGWVEIKANPLSRVGIFPYSGRQLGLSGPDADRVFQVYRPEEELSAPECVESFKLIPWINDHTMIGPVLQKLTSSAIPAEAKGVEGVVGEEVFYADGYLRGNIKVFSDTLAENINDGKVELSAGYRCIYDMTPGVYEGQRYDAVQRQIRGNHLALVAEGRMGPSVAVLDAFTFTIDAQEFSNMDPKATKDGEGGSAPTLADAIKMLGEIAPQVAALNAAVAKLSAPAGDPAATEDTPAPVTPAAAATAADAAAKATADAIKVAQDAAAKATADLAAYRASAPKEFMATVARRDALSKRLVPLVGAFDHSLMSVEEVAAYGCDKLKITATADQALPMLEGYLQAAAVTTPAATVAADAAPDATSPVALFLNGTK